MASPPSSPLHSSPPSSLPRPDFSPPSSPIQEESPPKKRRSWLVYNPDAEQVQLSKSKSWRWKALGVSVDNEEDEELLDGEPPGNGSVHGSLEDASQDMEPEIHQEAAGVDHRSSSSSDLSYISESSENCESIASDDSNGSTETDSESDSGNERRGNETSDSENSIVSESSDSDEPEDYFYPLYEGSKYSVDEAILDIPTDHIQNHETRKSLDDHLKTFLKHIPKHNNMPKTSSQLLQQVERLAPAYQETPLTYCSKCHFFLENGGPCSVCNCEKTNQFYVCSVQDQLKYYFEKFNLADVIDKYCETRKATDGVIRDILDGSECARVTEADNVYNVTLMMNTDGVSLSQSSNTKMWPVMYVICQVPPQLRKQFLLVSGIWCDSEDPPINTFLMPFVKSLEKIEEDGGVLWTHPVTLVQHCSRVFVPLICADAPARAKLQNILSHNGKQGCNTCEQRSVKIPLTVEERRAKAAGNKKIRRKRGYLYCEVPARLRTHQKMKKQAREAANLPTRARMTQNVKGVKGPSIVSFIPRIDISKCCYAEYMHGVCLGVVKTFLTLWLTVSGEWNISAYKTDIDNFLESIAPTSDICRLPRGVKEMKHWKASEFRAWLLFYSLPCLSGKLPDKYFQHWCLLVMSIFLLLQEEISENDLNVAETMLRIFVRDVGRLYRLSDYIYNIHQLLHLPLYVRWFGPLWSTSAFLFEGYNKNLVGLIHGTKNRGKELMKNVRIAQGVEILRSQINGNKMSQEKKKNFVQPLNVCKNLKLSVEDQRLLAANDLDASIDGVVFQRVRLRREIFTSLQYTLEKKRNNYTIKFQSPTTSGYGLIKYFVLKADGEVFAVVEKLRIDHTRYFCHTASAMRVKHTIPVEDVPECNVVVNVKEFIMKVIRIGNTVSYLPNSFEKNL